ncbi:VF530 family DNA-binding protein [Psychromonas sp.]|uniref:VF530 family protein n=1 Tax=Psychromonas sp. TaxID=1884585 RepID=UPI0035653317
MLKEQQNNPLHGLKLETLLTELVAFYGWDILFAALRFHCFKTNPSIDGSLKFLRKTEWAREKLEGFYLYRFKRMPKPDQEEYELPHRARGFAAGIVPREPMVLTIESIELSQAKAASHFKEKSQQQGRRQHSNDQPHKNKRNSSYKAQQSQRSDDPANPWGKIKK